MLGGGRLLVAGRVVGNRQAANARPGAVVTTVTVYRWRVDMFESLDDGRGGLAMRFV